MNKVIIPTVLSAGLIALTFGVASAAEKKTVTYENTIKKIMDDRCMACHGADSPTIEAFKKDEPGFKKKMKGPRMDTYENLMVFVNGSDAGALMRRLDNGKHTKDGKPGNMYVNLADDDRARAARFAEFNKWVGSWNLKKRKELTEAELKAVKAPKK
ncbi:MAG: cytochrome C [Pseudomonadota bacterium]